MDGVGKPRPGAQGRQLGAEHQSALKATAAQAPVERLLPEAIAGQLQTVFTTIPESQGKHAHTALQGDLQTPGLNRSQQGFRIGMAAPGATQQPHTLQLVAKLQMVVDLSVEGDHITPTGAAHRLMAGGRSPGSPGAGGLRQSLKQDHTTPRNHPGRGGK